jgi:hypothetical protein
MAASSHTLGGESWLIAVVIATTCMRNHMTHPTNRCSTDIANVFVLVTRLIRIFVVR